ncbi:peptide ABC transporter substrate-binding protein [Ligilactobacillus sp. Marseille-Q7487]|uniref:peptide ABC transporter substrate-binding protein n=1 Tax=Ligilactobacillus sp. Marseille-Q7487 TaxID=3022128 RepID=UPI0024A9D4D8|nr:peptide ABC transporter substrate-binding protein [Ligilactobacillus sp. Marseille-Q7487]
MKLKKLLVTGTILACSSLTVNLLIPASASAASSKKALNWSIPSELSTIDPSKVTDTYGGDMVSNTLEGLYRLGKNSKIESGMAKKTTVSDDGLTYTFTLRSNNKWSNGDPVTAQDFVYSWQRTVDPKTASSYAYLFDGIKNANDIMAGTKAPETLGVKAQGKYKLVVTLEKQIPYFKLLMGFDVFFPQNQKAVEKYGDKYGTAAKYMVYNGPFKMVGWDGSNLKWKLVKNNSYWDKKNVKLKQINFQVTKSTTTSYNLYQANKLDQTNLSAEQARQLKNQSGYTVLKQARTNYLEFNQTMPIFQNQKIRQAISYAINRKPLANTVIGGGSTPAKSVVSSGLASRDGVDFVNAAKTSVGTTYNKKKAQQLLQEGLKEIGKDSLSFTLLGDDTDASKKITEYLQSQIEANLPGTKVTVENVPFKTRVTRSQNTDFEVVVSSWQADFSDPISFLDMFTSNNSYNFGKWKNADYDKLITASKTTDATDPAKRWDDLVAASKLLNEDQGVVPLVQINTPQMIRPDVKGLIQNTAGITNNWKNVYFK